MNISEKYLMEALDAYPYDLPKTLEALNYALSYDDENPQALCLMGQFYCEQLIQYDKAKEYYARALAADNRYLKLYAGYIDVLLYNDDFDEAEKLIAYALTMKGIDRALMYNKKALLHEYRLEFKKSLKSIEKAFMYAFNSDFFRHLESDKQRVEEKMKKKKNRHNNE